MEYTASKHKQQTNIAGLMRSLTIASVSAFNPEKQPSGNTSSSQRHTKRTDITHKREVPIGRSNFRTQHSPRNFLLQTRPLQPTLSHTFSNRITNLITYSLENSWATSTTQQYSSAVRHFLNFCDAEQVPNLLRFPTDEFVLCAYAASGAGSSSGDTIKKRFTALKAWHHTHNVGWHGSMRLHLVLNGVANLTPDTSIRPPRPPISATMLSQLIAGLNLHDPLDAAIAACASNAFWAQCRLGELLPSACSDFSTIRTPSRGNIRTSKRDPTSNILFLPQTKTKRRGENVILLTQNGNTNPVALLQNHLRVNKMSQHMPMYAYSTNSGPCSLSRHRFLVRCNTIWSALGYPRATGHSFRIGGTTELLLAGVPPDVVKTMGRWSSDAFLRYWRLLEDIAPRYARNLPPRTSQKRKRNESPQ